MWRAQLRYDLHPSIQIPSSSEQIRIADLGCGNGVWLTSLATDPAWQTKTVSFHGFDIQRTHYPAATNLPANVTLGYMDVFAEDIPQEHIGVYDVVHVRAFASVVKHGDPVPVLTTSFKMLKPGGYLQWDDLDAGTFHAILPGSSKPSDALKEFFAVSAQAQKVGMGLEYGWLWRWGELFGENGFEIVEDERMEVRRELRDVMTTSYVLVHEHIARHGVVDGKLVGTDADWADVWGKAREEVAKGASLVTDLVVAVARKPL
ncbi:unnamed protein product [Periconia digitata]|uniref:Methyltransferase type 12 domain-containing protein n=1 Tax=Periconia digitata TaxID=1303443 RepID=A0A9W4UKB4_9PLEO|nr:unnamed protein product [Periconia digitata]